MIPFQQTDAGNRAMHMVGADRSLGERLLRQAAWTIGTAAVLSLFPPRARIPAILAVLFAIGGAITTDDTDPVVVDGVNGPIEMVFPWYSVMLFVVAGLCALWVVIECVRYVRERYAPPPEEFIPEPSYVPPPVTPPAPTVRRTRTVEVVRRAPKTTPVPAHKPPPPRREPRQLNMGSFRINDYRVIDPDQ